MAIPSISDGQSDRKPVSSELHKIILAKVQKGYKLLLKKDQISISCKKAYLQIMSFITTKFHEILFLRFQWSCAYELWWVVSLILVKFLSSKRGIIPRIKIESEFPVDMHIYTLSPSLLQSFGKFCWAVSEDCFSSIFSFGQISKFKKGVTPRKKINQNFLWICTSTWYHPS